MSTPELLLISGILLFFGLIIAVVIRSDRKARETKRDISQSLGFTPVDPDPELFMKITQLYRHVHINRFKPGKDFYELNNVSSKNMLDGVMFLFDLIDTSGEDDSYTEQQAVAMISPHLNLPPFLIFPKADIDGAVANVANKILGWLISKVGNPVAFPEYPEFEGRYLVSSPDPDGTRRFLDDNKIRRLANTRQYGIHAGGDIFTMSRIDLAAKPLTKEMMSERVNQVMGVFSIFLS